MLFKWSIIEQHVLFIEMHVVHFIELHVLLIEKHVHFNNGKKLVFLLCGCGGVCGVVCLLVILFVVAVVCACMHACMHVVVLSCVCGCGYVWWCCVSVDVVVVLCCM